MSAPTDPTDHTEREWFDRPREPGDGPGLRFACTQCGNCCTGPPGFVMVSDAEAGAMAHRLGLSVEVFHERYTRPEGAGRSLTEHETEHGYDCVFLDRTTHPGRAICSVYEDRPMQCRTWPFWKSNLRSPGAWDRSARRCPGMNAGRVIPPEQIRIQRAKVDI